MSAAIISPAAALSICSAPSPLGYIAVVVVDDTIASVSFGNRSARTAERDAQRRVAPCGRSQGVGQSGVIDEELAEDALARLVRYAGGERVELSDLPVALARLTPFQRRVVEACRAIGWGRLKSYAQLAAAAGNPGAARAVGQVMASNRVPLIVPCHRVVSASGGLGGFSAPQGVEMKARLLSMEAAADGRPRQIKFA